MYNTSSTPSGVEPQDFLEFLDFSRNGEHDESRNDLPEHISVLHPEIQSTDRHFSDIGTYFNENNSQFSNNPNIFDQELNFVPSLDDFNDIPDYGLPEFGTRSSPGIAHSLDMHKSSRKSIDENLEECDTSGLDHLLAASSKTTGVYSGLDGFNRSTPTLQTPRPTSGARRSLPRRRSHYTFQNITNGALPMASPNLRPAIRHERFISPTDPMQRWQSSSLNTAGPIAAVRGEYEQQFPDDLPFDEVNRNSDQFVPSQNVWTTHRAPSRAHSVTGSETSDISNASDASTTSQRARKVSRRRKVQSRKQRARTDATDEKRMFKCTFCCDNFKNKYDWGRHEKSLHLNIGGWKCAPYGYIVKSPGTDRFVCAFCNVFDPSPTHLESHHCQACIKSIGISHVFLRKDHLTQHLRLIHRLEVMPLIDTWKVGIPKIQSRCGFCDEKLQSWEEREDHLAAHFRDGLTMENWRGDHGFDPEIEAKVINSLPPYVLGNEAKSLVPFSATSSESKDHYEQISTEFSKLGGWHQTNAQGGLEGQQSSGQERADNEIDFYSDVLAMHLSQYAREQMLMGVVPTDKMFQAEARKIFYGCDDEWNTTIADNKQWISTFRNHHDWNLATNPES